ALDWTTAFGTPSATRWRSRAGSRGQYSTILTRLGTSTSSTVISWCRGRNTCTTGTGRDRAVPALTPALTTAAPGCGERRSAGSPPPGSQPAATDACREVDHPCRATGQLGECLQRKHFALYPSRRAGRLHQQQPQRAARQLDHDLRRTRQFDGRSPRLTGLVTHLTRPHPRSGLQVAPGNTARRWIGASDEVEEVKKTAVLHGEGNGPPDRRDDAPAEAEAGPRPEGLAAGHRLEPGRREEG